MAFFVITHAVASEIVATLPPLAGLIEILDPDAATSCLLRAGSDPHHFQLTPRQVESVGRATLLVRSSRDDKGWLHLASDTPTVDLWPEADHAWLSPDAVAKALPRLADALISAQPERTPMIRGNLQAALAKVDRIDASLAAALAPWKKKGVIVQHPSWRRVFERYGVPVLDILESDRHGHEQGPHHFEEALAIVKAHPQAMLVGDLRHSNRSLEWLADHSGNPLLYLDGLGQCGDDWPALMQRNIERIRNR